MENLSSPLNSPARCPSTHSPAPFHLHLVIMGMGRLWGRRWNSKENASSFPKSELVRRKQDTAGFRDLKAQLRTTWGTLGASNLTWHRPPPGHFLGNFRSCTQQTCHCSHWRLPRASCPCVLPSRVWLSQTPPCYILWS